MAQCRVKKVGGLFVLLEDAETQKFGEEVLSPERWKRLKEVFHTASPMNENERLAFLNEACADDEELRREANSLLAADDIAHDFLQSPVCTLIMKVLADEGDGREMSREPTEVNALSAET